MESSRRVNPSTIDLLLTRRSALAKDLIAPLGLDRRVRESVARNNAISSGSENDK